jgi:site-specific recombinase XerD
VSIYRYERRVWLALNGPKGINLSEGILPANKKKLLEYAKYLEASRKSLPRQDKLLRTVKIFASLLGPIPFKKTTKKDVVDVLAKYGEGLRRTVPGGGSLHTTSDFQKIVKQFYAWVYDIEDPRHDGYPKAVGWIRVKEPKSTLKASDLLEPADVKKLIAATPDLRLKALVNVCYECGLRVGEVLQMHVRDVNVQEQYAALTVSGKTGPRQAYSIESLPLLAAWLDQHPDRNNPDAWLWTDDTKPLTYDAARFKLQECRRKAKISKRVFWHLFRHSSATNNAELGEPMLRNVYGWSKNSNEPSTYIHLSREAVKKALLQKAGVQQKTEAEPKVIMCPRCKCPNEPTATLCVKCKSVLKIQDAISINGIVAEIDTLKSMLSVAIGLQTGYPTKRMTFEEIKQLADGNKAFVELARKRGVPIWDGKK